MQNNHNVEVPKDYFGFIKYVIQPYRVKFTLFFVLSGMGIIRWAGAPYIIKLLINHLEGSRDIDNTAWILVGAFFVIRLLDEWFWRAAEYVTSKFKPEMILRVRANLYDAVSRKPHEYFVNSSSGQLGHWVNQTTSTLDDMANNTIWGTWPNAMGMIISAGFLFATHWTLAMIYLVWLILLLIFNIHRGRTLSKLFQEESDEVSKASGMVVDALANHTSVRAFNSRQYELSTLDKQANIILAKRRRTYRFGLKTNAVKGNSIAFVGGIAMVQILYLYKAGTISLGDIGLFIAYFTAAASSIWELAWQLDQYYKYHGTIKNALSGLLSHDDERTVENVNHNTIPKTVEIELVDLCFSYSENDTKKVLNKLSFKIKPGERVGVVGHSGAGKSTLTSLLLGFYQPTAGKILVNGKDVNNLDPSYSRAISAYVPQDTGLFNRTLRENIIYAKPDASPARLDVAITKSYSKDFIEELPKGLDTLVGERGVKLSGGQRQRIAIARAILKDAPVLLLDEATSALDSASEHAIQKALHELMKGKTTIVIAHRLSTLKNLDRIIVLDKGKIAEQGTHDELIKKNGIYEDLWKRQKDGFIVE